MTTVEWPILRLGTLLTDIQTGFASGKHNLIGEGVPHFRPMNVSTDGRIDRAVTKSVDPAEGRGDLRLRRGDVLFNNTNSPELVGKTALFGDEDNPAFSNHMTRLRTDSTKLDREYLALRLHQAWRNGWFAAHCNNHVSQASIGRDVLLNFEIETPPLAVQRTIATLIRATDERKFSCRSHLISCQSSLVEFRQSVLAAACSGRLTAEWRKETGAPEWSMGRADEVCSKVQSGTTPKIWHTGDAGIPFLKVYNIVGQKIDFDYRSQFISAQLHNGSLSRATALPGDVVMNIAGPPLGKVAIVTDQYPEWSINQALTLFRPSMKVMSEWLYIFLCSGISVGQVLNETRGTVGQVNISLSQCRGFEIPVPSLTEQREIALRVSNLIDRAESFNAKIKLVSELVNSSSQSVLASSLRREFLSCEVVGAS